MRKFTDAEKQQLQTEIETEQERQQAIQEVIQSDEKRLTETKLVLSNLWRYGFLAGVFCLLAFNVFLLLKWTGSSHVPYVNLVVAFGLLFHHIAFYFTKTGWPSLVMKTIATIWVVFAVAYAGWALYIQLA